MKKYIFVTGGVCSSLGKGIASASLGCLLESRGFSVRMIKIDPYINVDAGTMSPFQHGEVYVTDDGAETDLDLGNYARFTASPLSCEHSITTGQIYQKVINKEREGQYLGRTVQVVPHITDEIKHRIYKIGDQPDVDVAIIEVGGTVGDIESIPYLEAVRQIIHERGRENALSVHLALVPTVTGGEVKTKPAQHSVKAMREIGIQPEILLCRASFELPEDMRKKISLFTNIDFDSVISAHDVNTTIYEIPLIYHQQGLDSIVTKKLKLPESTAKLKAWEKIIKDYKNPKATLTIGVVGKYIDLPDSYKSIDEALYHGGFANSTRVKLIKIDSELLEKDKDPSLKLKELDGILIPGGFGQRGIEGMILAIKYARENKIPLFGICLGMQTMVIEYARNVLGLKEANSSEFYSEGPHSVIALLADQVDITTYGGTMRLGQSQTILKEETIPRELYGSASINERHRHRFEVSNKYRNNLEEKGLIIAGQTPDKALVEVIQLPEHPWGIGVQYHPEFKSRPTKAHPLFKGFIKACLDNEK